MNVETAKDELKRITDEVLGSNGSHVESTLESRVFNIYTEVWQITREQLAQMEARVDITAISVEGYNLMLTAKI